MPTEQAQSRQRFAGLTNLFSRSSTPRTAESHNTGNGRRGSNAAAVAVPPHQALSIEEEQDDLPTSPMTAPGGWGTSLLTWRAAPPPALLTPTNVSAVEPTYDVDATTPLSAAAAAGAKGSTGRSRARGAIPFAYTSSSGTESAASSPSRTHLALPTEEPSFGSEEETGDTTALEANLDDALRTPGPSLPYAGADAKSTLSRLSLRRSVPALSRAALAEAQSAHTSPASTTSSPGARGTLGRGAAEKARLWGESQEGKIRERERLDECVRQCVGQAGVDFESRPIVVLTVSALPDPKVVDYDALLARLLSAMDLFVENDYTVVLFAAAARHRPGWTWLWKAYRRLGRKFRKNLKRLYIVHPTLFTRTLVQFVSTGSYFVSPKFARKIVQCNTLAELGQHVPLQQIELAPEVLTFDLSVEAAAAAADATGAGGAAKEGEETERAVVFGAPLEELMGSAGELDAIPRVVRDCVEALRAPSQEPNAEPGAAALDTEGIFRRSPPSASLKAAQYSYDRGHPVNLARYNDPHVPAVLLKMYLRHLPEPLFPAGMYSLIKACPSPATTQGEEEAVEYIGSRILPALDPPCKLILLSYVVELLHDVAKRAERNKMTSANLATVLAPNLVRSGDPMRDVAMCRVEGLGGAGTSASAPATLSRGGSAAALLEGGGVASHAAGSTTLGTVLRVCIDHAYDLFEQTRVEPPTLSFASDESLEDVPSSPAPPPSSALPSIRATPRSSSLAAQDSTPASSLPSPSSPSSLSFANKPWTTSMRHALSHKRNGSGSSAPSTPSSPPSRVLSHMASFATASPGTADSSYVDASPSARRTAIASTPVAGVGRSSITTSAGGEGSSHRGPSGLRTLSRNTSGSLRLTKGRLSGGASASSMAGSLRGAPSLATSTGTATMTRSTSGDGSSTVVTGLSSSSSGVALTGVSAAGFFTGPSGSTSSSGNLSGLPGYAVERETPSWSVTSNSGAYTPSSSAPPSPAPKQSPQQTQAHSAAGNNNAQGSNGGLLLPSIASSRQLNAHARPLSEVVEDIE